MPPKSNPPARLDSLNRRGTTPATRGRFAPKVVARRSKEERDKTAPTEKPVENDKKFDRSERGGRGRGGSDRGRGRGGSRGRGRFQPVSVAAMGPFASPGQVHDNTRRSFTPSFEMKEGTPSYNPAQLRVKSETPGVDSDTPGPEDDNRIDMTSNIPIDGELAAYFPIRLDRREEENVEEIPLPEPQVARERDEVKVKDEPTDEPQQVAPKPKYITAHERKELERIHQDHEQITDEFSVKTSLNDSKASELEQRLYFFQFPAVLPELKNAEGDDEPAEGLAGHLRLHQSGKLTMVLGDIVMEVFQGAECNFLQDVVVMDKEEKKSYLIGQVTRKMIVSPDIERLLS